MTDKSLRGQYLSFFSLKSNATDDQIRKAYRTLAMKWHPDRNSGNPHATKLFQQISVAYTYLLDGENNKKRKAADEEDDEVATVNTDDSFVDHVIARNINDYFEKNKDVGYAPGQVSIPTNMTFKDEHTRKIMDVIYKNATGKNAGLASGNGAASRFSAKLPSIIKELPLTLEEISHGCSKDIKINRRLLTGALETKTVVVRFPVGCIEGYRHVLKNHGNEEESGIDAADIIVRVVAVKDDVFMCDGTTLLRMHCCNKIQAAMGFVHRQKMPDGRMVLINVPSFTGKNEMVDEDGVPTFAITLVNEGLPKLGSISDRRGDFCFQVQVKEAEK